MSIVAIAGQTFRLRLELESQAAPGTFVTAPTVAAGDVKLLILPASPTGSETFANSTNAPSVLNGPTAEVIIAAAETAAAGEGGEIIAVWADAAGDEWYSLSVHIQVKAADVAVAGDEMDLVAAPNATALAAVVAAIDADPPSVNVTKQAGVAVAAADANGNIPVDLQTWLGDSPSYLDTGAVQASVLSVGSVSSIVNANVVQYNNQPMYYGNVSSVAGNVITTTGIKTTSDGAALADDKLVMFVGWQAVFYRHISGYPPTDVLWRTTIVSYTKSAITVDAMPPDDLSFGGFEVYIIPPSFGTSINGQDIADALLLAPVGVAADGSAMDYLVDIAAAGGMDLDTVLETPVTLGEALRVMLAALAGETAGSGTPALTFLGQDGATVRISATVDGIGNRTAVTVDGA